MTSLKSNHVCTLQFVRCTFQKSVTFAKKSLKAILIVAVCLHVKVHKAKFNKDTLRILFMGYIHRSCSHQHTVRRDVVIHWHFRDSIRKGCEC